MIWTTISRYSVAFTAGYAWAIGASTAVKVGITFVLAGCIVIDVIDAIVDVVLKKHE